MIAFPTDALARKGITRLENNGSERIVNPATVLLHFDPPSQVGKRSTLSFGVLIVRRQQRL